MSKRWLSAVLLVTMLVSAVPASAHDEAPARVDIPPVEFPFAEQFHSQDYSELLLVGEDEALDAVASLLSSVSAVVLTQRAPAAAGLVAGPAPAVPPLWLGEETQTGLAGASVASGLGAPFGRFASPSVQVLDVDGAVSRTQATLRADVERSFGPLRGRKAKKLPAWPVAFAKVGGVPLMLPSKQTVLVGFHQASSRSALAQDPRQAATAYSRLSTLPSRGRGTDRRSAADIAVPSGNTIYSPVSGKVVSVQRYSLYGKYRDTRITIRPDAAPHRLVKVLHVKGALVRKGQWVGAGQTAIADSARLFPFRGQIEKYVGRVPHIHVEVLR